MDMTARIKTMNLFDGTFANIIKTRRGYQIDILGVESEHTKSVWDEIYPTALDALGRIKELNLALAVFVD